MNEREKIIRLWFDMWIKKADLGIDNIFTDDVVYTESWSPKYENRKTVKHSPGIRTPWTALRAWRSRATFSPTKTTQALPFWKPSRTQRAWSPFPSAATGALPCP